jgi:hypothetical protein
MSTDAPKVTRSPSWRIIYTNILGIGFGDNDVRLMCGFDQDLGNPGQQVIEEAIVVMTPRQAKMLSHSLNSVISNFEAANGPIPVPADKIKKIDDEISAQADARRKKPAET